MTMAIVAVSHGEGCQRAADAVGLSKSAVLKQAKKMGLKLRKHGGQPIRPGHKRAVPSAKAIRVLELYKTGLTKTIIAKRLGHASTGTVRQVLKRWLPQESV